MSNKEGEIERQTDGQEKINLFIREKKRGMVFFGSAEGSTYTCTKIFLY